MSFFDFLKRKIKKSNSNVVSMKQGNISKKTGLITLGITPENWISSALPMTDEKIDYSDYLPDPEPQHSGRENYFDTMGCTAFSALNILETVFNYKIANEKFSDEHINFLKNNGYIKNGKVNFSDRWLFMISNTKPIGNDFVSVWNAVWKIGLIPESDLPFGGNSWHQYNDKSLLTEEMYKKAEEFQKYFVINFAWVFFGNYDKYTISDFIDDSVQTSPFHVAAPTPATHAMMLYDKKGLDFKFFDTYSPFIKASSLQKSQIHYAMRAVVTAKEVKQSFVFVSFLKKGMRGYEVEKLQERVGATADGIFGPITKKYVERFQSNNKLVADGLVGKNTRAVLNTPKVNKNKFNTVVDITLDQEGGLSMNPDDKGNWTGGEVGSGELKGTKYGISAASYPYTDIKNLTREDAKAIYFKDYWNVCRCGKLPVAIALNIFDTAVNHGITVAPKLACEAIGMSKRTIMDDTLVKALKNQNNRDFLNRFYEKRVARYRKSSVFSIFGAGWLARAEDILVKSITLL